MYPEEMYDYVVRRKKANKILAVLRDCLRESDGKKRLLDVGCSTGIITSELSRCFDSTLGIDIDRDAVEYAKKHFSRSTLDFSIQDSMNFAVADNSIDVAVCNQVYEHVPDAARLMSEILRVLKPGAICYFAAENRFNIMEHHYNLPFLSVVPRRAAHFYLRLMRRGDYYYERLYTYWELKRLASRFEIVDYTSRIIREPERFHADDLVKPGSAARKIALLVLKTCYWLFPAYIWILKKKPEEQDTGLLSGTLR